MSLATTPALLTLNDLRTRLRSFCENHPIEKLEVFGSVAKELANHESDVDLLATFSPGIPQGFAYFTFVQHMQDELIALLGYKVDLLDRESVEHSRNPIRRNEILGRAKVIYEHRA
jgi:predicted nucleotidyltransferase